MLRKIMTASLVAVSLAGATLATSDPAEARYRRHGAFWGGAGLGILGGALLTGGYGYGYPGYGYGYGYPAYGYGYPGYGYPGYGYGYGYPVYGYSYPSYGYTYPTYGYRRYVYSYPRYSYRNRRFLNSDPSYSNRNFGRGGINGQTDRN